MRMNIKIISKRKLKRKILSLCLLGLLLLIASAGCGKKEDTAEYTEEVFAMDTYMTLKAYGSNAQEALKKATAEIDRLDHLWSVGENESEVSLLNKKKEGKVSDETMKLLNYGSKISTETEGAFDLTVYPLMEAWGFTTRNYRVPAQKEIQGLLKSVDMDHVKLDVEQNLVRLTGNTKIDLGGIAKGYTSQKVATLMKESGVEHGMISLGGNVQAIGTKIDGSRWKVGIKSPNDSMDMVGVYEAEDESVITSGGYERYFKQDGIIYHHILDPKTGYPSKQDLLSVTIVSQDGTLADCLSTTLFVMGKDKAEAYWRGHQEKFDMILVDKDSHIFVTEAIKDRFTSEYEYQVIK